MKLDSKSTFSPDPGQETRADPAVLYILAHREGLWHAARLLGGYASTRLVDRCAELLARDQRLTPRTRIMLWQLLDLLSLERVDNPELPYMGYFALIDPLDPVIAEICLLTDGLRDALNCAGGEPAQTREVRAA